MKRRCKDKFRANLVRKVAHLPYGSQRCYGSAINIKNTNEGSIEVCVGVINKSKARQGWRKDILKVLCDY